MLSKHSLGLTALTAACLLIPTISAHAVQKERTFYTNPVGVCQAALPAYEGLIRKRPLAVQNESDANAYVTCSYTSQGKSISEVNVNVSSINSVAHSVSCTGITGANGEFFGNQYVVKQVSTPASNASATLTWTGSNFDDNIPGPPTNLFPSPMFSIQCILPPGAAINDANLVFAEDVGT